jgi:hypothetical protein
MSPAELAAEATASGGPIYWAGAEEGFSYEFTRAANGYSFVRYLPEGVPAGAPDGPYLIVATYPFGEAYGGGYLGLKVVAHGRGVTGPGGSFLFARPKDPRSVLLAFRGVPYQVEVFDPKAWVSANVAESGTIQPVG